MHGIRLSEFPIHLGLGARADVEPAFTASMDWYEAYVARHAQDGAEGRLVSLSSFSEPWSAWERHPHGAEVVLCLSGSLQLHQEADDGTLTTITLAAGEYAINPAGVWHTADVSAPATALFITCGLGTEHRER